MPLGTVWRMDQSYRGAWAFVGPRWPVYDEAWVFALGYVSPVIAPAEDEDVLLLSGCDTSSDVVGRELIEAVRVTPGRRAMETADRLCAAYYELLQAVELSGIERVLDGGLECFRARRPVLP